MLKQRHARETLDLKLKQERELADLLSRIEGKQKDHDDRKKITLPSISRNKRKANNQTPGPPPKKLPTLAPLQAFPVVRSEQSKFFPIPRVPNEIKHAKACIANSQMRKLASIQQRSLLRPGNKRPCAQIQLPRSGTMGDKENKKPS